MDRSFSTFIDPITDRLEFIDNWLSSYSIPHTILEIGNKRHVIVRFPNTHYDPRFEKKLLIAHYDRAPQTQGANDNSAACFQLMHFARDLLSFKPFQGQSFSHNIQIIFTDGEEAAGTAGIQGQGSYALGTGLKKIGTVHENLFVFDVTGCGDTLVVSTTGLTNAAKGSVGDRVLKIHNEAIEIARKISPENWIRLPTPFSDNAGFLAAGIPAQVITVLPHEEASKLLINLGRGTEQEINEIERKITMNSLKNTDCYIPQTWLRMHTDQDTAQTLSPEAFSLIKTFLNELAFRMNPAEE